MKSTINDGKIKHIWDGPENDGEDESTNLQLLSTEESGTSRTYKLKASFKSVTTACLCGNSKIEIGSNIFADVNGNKNLSFNTEEVTIINKQTSSSCGTCPGGGGTQPSTGETVKGAD